ncbi:MULTISPECIES: tRNA (adenosine(37)-N6)-threonylcarbamoyltransferase complex dimerization subunit type 1 TsaB [Protofrankia]|uniref:Peptidase M22 n=1 Tax=Protofrankia coriariae TaxID=1562887 RepID=A0ABR5F7H2_9ACTN|nr:MULTISPECIES: tRNA (adenosine(37)-N6)-threonylcarbamoyltransferase complex dimerization subunit type 1 TsaB [Protofrankia]KLL12677.1 peptidase M22 [Protofrankia coriariae]ONH36168.1 tRNA (adenosine(37)-N6)-threonylcarbamoyltransferase complex dimerization subunit type 1 TsaB [Protofrankia sp. BMG5.30]
MLLIALDTATPACSVALVDVAHGYPPGLSDAAATPATAGQPAATAANGSEAGAVVGGQAVVVTGRAARQVVDPRRHAELLVPLVREVLDEAAVRPADLDGVVVGLGPGPFTSLRVGVVTAGAFADALGKPAYGICSLDGVGAGLTGRVAVATDARRREVYWAVYADGARVAGPFVDRPRAVVDALREMSVSRLVGPGAALYPDVFADLAGPGPHPWPASATGARTGAGPDTRAGTGSGTRSGAGPGQTSGPPRTADPGYPSPVVLARLAAADVLARRPPAPLVPLYLRRPDAAEPHPPKTVAV